MLTLLPSTRWDDLAGPRQLHVMSTQPDSGRSDRELVETMRVAGSDAFAVLFRRHVAAVYGYAASIVNNRADADEVVQETFVLAWAKLEAKRMPGTSALPWLLSVARNHGFNLNRARARQRSVPLLDADQDGGDVVVESAMRSELASVVAQALDKLSPVDRAVVDRCLRDGQSYKEAAKAMGLSVAGVRNRLARSRDRLRVEITAQGGMD